MHPEHSQKVFWVDCCFRVAVLVQVFVFHESLASVNFRLEVLPIHEDVQKAFRGLKAKDPREIPLRVILSGTFRFNHINFIIRVNNL